MTRTQNEQMQEAIQDAKKIMNRNSLKFATIWKTGKSYGFNFDEKPIGYKEKSYGVLREVVYIVNN